MGDLRARQAYNSFRQGAFESIVAAQGRFAHLLKGLPDQKKASLKESDIALDFLDGVNKGFAEVHVKLMNDITSGALPD